LSLVAIVSEIFSAMRLRSYLVGLAVIASSFIAVNPVESQSRNGWDKTFCIQDECHYVKKIGGSWPFIEYKSESPSSVTTQEADCQERRFRFLDDLWPNGKGPWIRIIPGSNSETEIEVVCR